MYFFDMDGTVLDSNGIWADIDRRFLGRWGQEFVPEDYSDFVTHHSFPEAAAYTRKRYGLPMTEEEIMDTWRGMAREAYAGQVALKPGVRDFLERAKGEGIRCAMLTSCLPDLCAIALEGHGLTGYFERIFTTQELLVDKRQPELYQKVAAECGEKPEDCIFFEDSPVNCAAAAAAGWQVYGVEDRLFAARRKEMEEACGAGHFPFSFLDPLPGHSADKK